MRAALAEKFLQLAIKIDSLFQVVFVVWGRVSGHDREHTAGHPDLDVAQTVAILCRTLHSMAYPGSDDKTRAGVCTLFSFPP